MITTTIIHRIKVVTHTTELAPTAVQLLNSVATITTPSLSSIMPLTHSEFFC